MKILLLFSISLLAACSAKNHTPESAKPLQVILAAHTEKRPDLEAWGKRYAISTQGKFSSLAAQRMFRAGGNIIDAAVAASFTISVERPHSSGLGGGGFFIYHDAKTSRNYAIDFRERAPAKAFEKMYIGINGKPDANLSLDGVGAAGVPGLVAGLCEIHQKFGKLPLAFVMQPAMELAEQGFPIYPDLEEALVDRAPLLAKDPEAKDLFLTKDNKPRPLGEILRQKKLARSLRAIANKGPSAFYFGPISESLLRLSAKKHGYFGKQDLQNYKVKWSEPLHGKYKDFDIYSMPPPSSGGLLVLQFLGFLEHDALLQSGPLSTKAIHLEASALQAAFADRAKFLGDPAFVQIPTAGLMAPEYLKLRRNEVDLRHARTAMQVSAGNPPRRESNETTHLSIIDGEGNAIATTQTVNGWMGAATMIPGTGIILNNEMDDFSAQEGASNLFGAIGGLANSIAPGKTPLSSMAPTLMLKDGQVVMSVGAPGGTRIISCVAQTIFNYTEFKLPLYESISMVRLHHQWRPDYLEIEAPGPGAQTKKDLEALGYEVHIDEVPCNVMAVTKENGGLHAVADPRDIGTSTAE